MGFIYYTVNLITGLVHQCFIISSFHNSFHFLTVKQELHFTFVCTYLSTTQVRMLNQIQLLGNDHKENELFLILNLNLTKFKVYVNFLIYPICKPSLYLYTLPKKKKKLPKFPHL